MKVVKSKTAKSSETKMSRRDTVMSHSGEKQALETAMWTMQVQPSIDATCEPIENELGDERSVATWENWTESSESGDTAIDDSSPSGTNHDAIDKLPPSSQHSIAELLNPHPTRSLNTTLLQDCITSYPKLFNESYLRVGSLSLAERRMLEPLKLKGLKWRWHPFMDVRNTHRGDVCVRTMDNDVFIRMMNQYPSITFRESRQKGKSNAPRDLAKIENKPDFSEIEIWGGRVLVWCIVGTTCWYDRHGMGEAYRECFIKYFPKVGIQGVLTFEQRKARPTFDPAWLFPPIDLRVFGFEIDNDITVSAGQYKFTPNTNTIITLRPFAEEPSETKICLVKGIFQNGSNKSDVIVTASRWKNVVLGSDTVTSGGKAVGLNWGLGGGGLAVANLILIEDL
ncbi:hypothetical protein FMEXI_985 [Fusarium mexicanum]|uniref:Uncharacterized protein n=1 Tax=Fusarium mexicanum TaxID=751941 RepID=A0A8H5JLT1_9HYPO|nr:hypothetical protein FMEXI_985 [Fusarium mexicanum]